MIPSGLTPRAYSKVLSADSWEEIWEAGPYFDRVSKLLEEAKSFVVLVGWQIDSRLRLKRPAGESETLREKLIRLCIEKPDLQIFLLFWDHAYLYVLERESWQGRIWDSVHPRIHFIFDNRHPLGGSHHEKIGIFDGLIALVGGIDLCDERWDEPCHLYCDPRRSLDGREEHHGPYHDMAIQVTGSVCAEIQAHVARRWKSISTIPFPDSFPALPALSRAGHRVYLSRTVAKMESKFVGPSMIREIEFLFRDLIGTARSRLILEGQYFWSKRINDMLISKVLAMKGERFEVILILADLREVKSYSRQMMVYELGLLSALRGAANYAGVTLTVGCPSVWSHCVGLPPPPKPVYIHSKILIVDDRYLGIGSANYATRALRIDSELQLTLEARSQSERLHIQSFAEKLLDHWNVRGDRSAGIPSGIRLAAVFPEIRLDHLPDSLNRTRFFPWYRFFDPETPWFFRLKVRLNRLSRRYSVLGWFGGLSSGTAAILSFIGGGLTWEQVEISVYVFTLTSVWFFPISFSWVVVLFLIQLGGFLGSEGVAGIVVLTFWTAAFCGYAWMRAFPEPACAIDREFKPVGRRDFGELLRFILNPFISVRSKIYYQGLYCTPLPWFFLGTILFQASLIYSAVRWGGAILLEKMPEQFLGLGRKLGWIILALELMRAAIETMKWRIWKKTGYGLSPIISTKDSTAVTRSSPSLKSGRP